MRIAWFRHINTDSTNPLDDTAALVDELRLTHDIDVIIEATAHDFVWRQEQQPWDLCVFELDNTSAHHFIWGYLPNYPGVVLLHSIDVANLRVAILGSRAVVVADSGLAERLQARFPRANLRYAPPFAACATPDDSSAASPATFAVYDRRARGRHLIERAFARARNAGAAFDVLGGETPHALARCDVVIAPAWPPFHAPLSPLLAAMAAGKAVITMETDATAEWPAIDPQTWRPRGLAAPEPPVAVTVDPRDEEHSLMLAIRTLSADAALRARLGRAARAWSETNATLARAVAAWATILREAATLAPPARPADWPAQFLVDGTELAQNIRGEFGLTSDPYDRPSSHS
jgi:glycosyltransferase involved in cell wall biosynthesis